MSKVFCDKPFNHIYVHTNGKFRLCCTTIQNIPSNDNYTLFDASKHNINEYWNSDRMKTVRQNMIAGRETIDCKRCYEQEAQGLQSLRSTEGMSEFIKNTKNDGTYNLPAKTMQLHMGNICNLKCKMCSQMYSHMNGLELLDIGREDPDWLHWVKQQGANVNNWTNELGKKQEWYKNVELKNKMFQYINDNITLLIIIGGEPTLIPEFYELFDYCESRGTLKDKEINLVTNLTNTNPRMTNWLPKLKRFSIWASIDGLGERTEYIRYPSQWNKILDNLNFYKKFLPGTENKITLSPAVQLLNIDQLDELIKWWLQFAGGELNNNFGFTWLASVWYPLICNPTIAPTDWKLKIADKLEKYKFDDVYNNYIKNLRVDQFDVEQKKYFQRAFIKYNDKQDSFRQVKKTWRQLIPDLETALTKSIG